MGINEEVLAAFQLEHKEQLEGIRSVLNAARLAEAPLPRASLDEAFRLAHSLKGGARVCDLGEVERLGHRLETLFSKAREGVLQLDHEATQTIDLVLNAIEDWMVALAEARQPDDPIRAVGAIELLLGESADVSGAFVSSASKPETPSAAPAEPPVPAPADAAVCDDILPKGAVKESAVAFTAAEPVQTMRVRAENLDDLLRTTDRLQAEVRRHEEVARNLKHLGQTIQEFEREWESVRRVSAASLHQLAGYPQFSRLSRYLEFVDHQVRKLAREQRQARLEQRRGAWAVRSLGNKLQHDVRLARLVTTESLFQPFRKMMRDLAEQEGKQLDFQVSGLELQADRMVLQALKDPLMHTLCNAVVHGIECSAERVAAGKPETGTVRLQLEAVGSMLSIVVEDDGRGIDLASVTRRAVAMGLISQTEAEQADTSRMMELVFRTGLTTSESVSGVAGRGIGLSVVSEVVTRLQGEVCAEARPGGGTIIRIAVPLSIASHRLLLVGCMDQTYAIPAHAIEQLLHIRQDQIEVLEGRLVLRNGARPTPLFSLASLLGRADTTIRLKGQRIAAVVMRWGERRMALAVDALLAERDALIKNLPGPAGRVALFAGAILLDGNTLALVVNPKQLFNGLTRAVKLPEIEDGLAAVEPKTPTVLVVDDSFTTRTLEKSILEAQGYRVRIAVDGLEAIAKLRAEAIDVVIADVEMPRLDGFGLLEQVRKDERLRDLPVILVTSRNRREDREAGLKLGANAYIVKQKFDHQALIETIRQFL